ncbi:MAG: LacI family transcriptional regulator [Erysipelotrichaceae bacterium]|nr:LacI family transcriptional regulator [Erysipelotrichaceae bacterium]
MVATINDVAKKAGVAISTVSKVLNNYTNVSKETKEKVLKVAQELNYVPNTIASALSSKNNNRVALYIYINDQRQAIDEINMQYLLGSFTTANKLGLHVITLFNYTILNLNVEEFIQYLQSQGINGLVVFGLNKEDTIIHEIIQREIFNTVVVDAPIYNTKTSSVSVDHYLGQYDVAKTAFENNQIKNVLYLAGKLNGYVTDQRIEGIKKLQKEQKFNLKIEYCDFSEKKAYETTLKIGNNYDAIVCASDLMAIGATNALKKLNINKLCCGYDGITLLGYAGNNILTCKQNFYNIAQTAINEMKRLMSHETGRQVLLDYEILRITYEQVIF